MSNWQVVILAVAILLAGVLGAERSQALGRGPFELRHHSNTAANAGVFRLDTATGGVSYCYLEGVQAGSGASLKCTEEVK